MGVVFDFFGPFDQVIQFGKNLLDFFIGKSGRIFEFILGQFQRGFSAFSAFSCSFAKLAPGTVTKFTLSVKGKFCVGLKNLMSSGFELIWCDGPGADVFFAWLEYRHFDDFDIEDAIEQF